MSRHAMVEVVCEWCGVSFMARRQRVEKGQSRFCSLQHCREWKKENPEIGNLGKENATMHLDSGGRFYRVMWIDPVTMKQKSTTWARWAWEMNFGEVPKGYRVSFKDDNSLNAILENLRLKSWKEYGDDLGNRIRGIPKSEEAKRKMSASHAGKVLSDEHKANIGKETKRRWSEGMYDSPTIRAAYSKSGLGTRGKKRTDAVKRILSEINKARFSNPEEREKQKQRQFSYWSKIENRKERSEIIKRAYEENPERKEKISQAMKGRVVTDKHRKNLSVALKGKYTGELASGYKDGKSIPNYPPDFSQYIKSYVRHRDGYMCQSCGEDVHGKRKSQVHHIDNIKENCDEENLILLCNPCHLAVHGKKNITNEMIEYLKTRMTR